MLSIDIPSPCRDCSGFVLFYDLFSQRSSEQSRPLKTPLLRTVTVDQVALQGTSYTHTSSVTTPPHPVQPRCRYGVLACTREGHSAPSTSKAFAPHTLMHAVPLGHKHGSYYPFAALALSSNPNSSHPPRSSSQSGCTLVYSVRSLCTIRGWDLD